MNQEFNNQIIDNNNLNEVPNNNIGMVNQEVSITTPVEPVQAETIVEPTPVEPVQTEAVVEPTPVEQPVEAQTRKSKKIILDEDPVQFIIPEENKVEEQLPLPEEEEKVENSLPTEQSGNIQF